MPEETNGSSKAASDIDTRTVTVTFFKNKAAAILRLEDVTLRQLADRIASQTAADKARLPLLKLARFGTKRTDRNCLRHDANVIEFGGGLLILLGWKTRWSALALAVFLVIITPIFHNFWSAPPDAHMEQVINFQKNVSILGGMLLLYVLGPGRYSLDKG